MEKGEEIFQRIGQFEDGPDQESAEWLGGGRGLALGVALIPAAVAATALLGWIAVQAQSSFVTKLCIAVWIVALAGVGAYWRRQRLAAHFEAAQRCLASADADQRQRGLVDLMVNARRGRAEHKRIARTLTAFLRDPALDHPAERGRRQLAFAMIADQTLAFPAKQALDLTGARLVGVNAVNAELPGVCLRRADLSGARFARANLSGAILDGARLDGADFTGAVLDGTILAGGSIRPPR